MLRLLSDENFNGDIVRGLLLQHPGLDLRRVQDVGLEGAEDPAILAWAAENDRIAIRQATEELLMLDACSEQAEWAGLLVYLPWV